MSKGLPSIPGFYILSSSSTTGTVGILILKSPYAIQYGNELWYGVPLKSITSIIIIVGNLIVLLTIA